MRKTEARKRPGGGLPLALLALLAMVPLTLSFPASADALRRGTTTLVSTFSDGTPADGAFPSVSSDGRYVAFDSFDRLTEEDTDDRSDVYRKDMATGETVLVSPNVSGVPFGSHNSHPSISADGNRVGYLSGPCFGGILALSGCQGNYAHVRDIAASTTILASNTDFRVESAQLSKDGGHVALVDEIEGWYGVASFDTTTGKYKILVPVICGGCVYFPLVAISETGRFVAFESYGRHVPNDLDGNSDVYRLDRDPDQNGVFDEEGKTKFELASILPAPIGGHPYGVSPAISDDGNVVGFAGALSVDGFHPDYNEYARDMSQGTTSLVSQNSFGVRSIGVQWSGKVMSLSSDGRYVAFSAGEQYMALGDSNPQWDVFLRDRQEGKTYLVSLLPDGAQGTGDRMEPSISADGRFIAFQRALILANRWDGNRGVYLRDRQPPCTIVCLEP